MDNGVRYSTCIIWEISLKISQNFLLSYPLHALSSRNLRATSSHSTASHFKYFNNIFSLVQGQKISGRFKNLILIFCPHTNFKQLCHFFSLHFF